MGLGLRLLLVLCRLLPVVGVLGLGCLGLRVLGLVLSGFTV